MTDFASFEEAEPLADVDADLSLLDEEFDAPPHGSIEEAALRIDEILSREGTLEQPEEGEEPGPESDSEERGPDRGSKGGEGDENPVFTIDHGGETREVSLSELAEAWGEHRATEEERKAFEGRKAEIESAFARAGEDLGNLLPALQLNLLGELAGVQSPEDLAVLARTDPARFAAIQTRTRVIEAARRQAEQIEELQTARMIETERAELARLVPELADPEKGEALRNDIVSYGLAQGFDDERLGLATAAEIAILHKAMRYDSLQGGRQRAAKRAKSRERARPVMPPGHARQSDPNAGYRKAMAKLRKTGHVDDAARVIDMIL